MPKANDLILVHFIEHQTEGRTFERTRNSWPLHITLVPWFDLEKQALLRLDLLKVCNDLQLFTVNIGELTMFGEDRSIPVSIIADQKRVKELHNSLLSVVLYSGGKLVTDNYTGNDYKAHVTHHAGDEQPVMGADVVVNEFSLVKLSENNICSVQANFMLGKDN